MNLLRTRRLHNRPKTFLELGSHHILFIKTSQPEILHIKHQMMGYRLFSKLDTNE